MRNLLTGLGLLALAGSIVPGATLADQNLNCDRYASQAVAQQKENQDRGCGFQGIGWSLNYQEHKAWCELDIVKMPDSPRRTISVPTPSNNAWPRSRPRKIRKKPNKKPQKKPRKWMSNVAFTPLPRANKIKTRGKTNVASKAALGRMT